MRIGLYLQDQNYPSNSEYTSLIASVKDSDIDLLVFPEACYTPNIEDFRTRSVEYSPDLEECRNLCLKMSQDFGRAIIYSGEDRFNTLFSIFANPVAREVETKTKVYIKHTATDNSAFDFRDYGQLIDTQFEPMIFRGYKLGMTICYDSNHALFSRAYGLNGADIIINSTGGNIVRTKWHRYQKVRAMENRCFTFCTMGFEGNYNSINSYTFGFTPGGKLMGAFPLFKQGISKGSISNVYVYDTDCDINESEPDIGLDQRETLNKHWHFDITPAVFDSIVASSIKVGNNLYVKSLEDKSLVLAILDKDSIYRPESVSNTLYDERLKQYMNKRYLIVNIWDQIDIREFQNKLSDVLKVRSMENYCAVLLLSQDYVRCYQCGKNRTAQVLKLVDEKYALDLSRMGGPETIWRDTPGMMEAHWRKGYELLLKRLIR
ncbi:MAG: carbon-nitrogen hydrolase family protein [Syntrophomonadaceae bacterium]